MSSCSRSRSLQRCSRGAAGWSRCWRSAARRGCRNCRTCRRSPRADCPATRPSPGSGCSPPPDAARGRRQDQCGSASPVRRPRVPRAIHRALHVRDHDQLAGAIRRFRQRRDRALGQGAARRQHEGGLTARGLERPNRRVPADADREPDRQRPPRADPPGEIVQRQEAQREADQRIARGQARWRQPARRRVDA